MNRAVNEITCKQYGTAVQTTDYNTCNTAHALCVLDNYGYIHTLNCFSTVNASQCYIVRTLPVLLIVIAGTSVRTNV